jgi:ABC-type glutathione transport system ATPase component
VPLITKLCAFRKPEIDDEEDGHKLESVEGRIELKNIHFNYPAQPELQIFKDFSLDVPAGKTIALVGESGSGKCAAIHNTTSSCMRMQPVDASGSFHYPMLQPMRHGYVKSNEHAMILMLPQVYHHTAGGALL